MLRSFSDHRDRWILGGTALIVSLLMMRTMLASGTVGYVDDWNVPNSSYGLWLWGTADFSPWQPIEYGTPTAYPTDFYLRFVLGFFGLIGVSPQVVIAVFLIVCAVLCFIGVSRLCTVLWGSPLALRLAAGTLYLASPPLFNALVPGYLTFVLSYAALPWLAVALVDALRGRRSSWFAYAFIFALSLAQIQFVFLDAALSIAILVSLRATLKQVGSTALFTVLGGALPFAFIAVNAIGVATLVSTVTSYSVHSWTSLSTPGILNAIMLLPSVYPFFDQSLGGWNVLWRAFAIVWVAAALVIGIRARSRAAHAMAGLLLLILIFLHGTHPPLTGLMTWLLDLGPLAILRNVNYTFALAALVLSILIAAPLTERPSRIHAIAAVCFALIWAWPLWHNNYSVWLRPLPVTTPTTPVLGSDSRVLVFPHLQVVASDQPSVSGVNINSVDTITPIFMRNTPTAALHAGILDRLTDWQPDALTVNGALDAARVNGIVLQTAFDSRFPNFVNSYRDLWLFDAYTTASFQTHLNAADFLATDADATSATFDTKRGHTDLQTADGAAVVDGGVEDEIALRALGYGGLYVPVDQAGPLDLSWQKSLVEDVADGDFAPSADDVRTGAFFPAGPVTTHETADFHQNWVDPIDSENWWLSDRLLTVPHAAITDASMVTLALPLPAGPRHVWLQVFRSAFGGTLRVRNGRQTKTVDTLSPALGAYHWIDIGPAASGVQDIDVTSVSGFNAIGNVAMLSDAAARTDASRLAGLRRQPRVLVAPNISIGESTPINISDPRWQPNVVLANFFSPPRIHVDAFGVVGHGTCQVFIGRGTLDDYSVELDGPVGNDISTNGFFPLTSEPCAAGATIRLNGVTLSSHPQTISSSSLLMTAAFSRSGATTARTLELPLLPLALPPLAAGAHTLTISSPPLLPLRTADWSALEDLQPFDSPHSNTSLGRVSEDAGGTRIDLSTTFHTVALNAPLRPPSKIDDDLLIGTYHASIGASIELSFVTPQDGALPPAPVFEDLPGDGADHEFHVALGDLQRSQTTMLRVALDPHGASTATGWVHLQSVPRFAANAFVLRPNFTVPPEQQPQKTSLGFDRYKFSGGRVVQYDQTFDRGWGLAEPAQHTRSQSGFNLWVRPHGGEATLRYRTGLIYVLSAAASAIALVIIGLLGLPIRWRRSA